MRLNRYRRVKENEGGQGMVEYGLILALVSVVAVGSLSSVGGKVDQAYQTVFSGINGEEVMGTYTVTFKDHEGNDLETIVVAKGEGVKAPDAPDLEGHTFIGWSGSLDNIAKDEVMTPTYEVNTYKVTFKDAKGKVLGEDTVNHGEGVVAPNIPNVTDDMWDRPLDRILVDGDITLAYALVRSPEDLDDVRNDMYGDYLQVADIDMLSYGKFDPIGGGSVKFRGTYDGGGYEIKNLHAYRWNYSGLFGEVDHAVIKNVGLTNITVGEAGYSGGLVGTASNRSLIENSYVTGSVIASHGYEAHNGTGGMVGRLNNSTIKNSYTITTVGNGSQAGGLVGELFGSSSIINSFAAGKVLGSTGSNADWFSRGGLVGKKDADSSVVNSYYDRQTSGYNDSGKGVGRSTSEMKRQLSFSGWDFDSVWEIKPGQYPTLK